MTQREDLHQSPSNRGYLAEGCGNSFIIFESIDDIEFIVTQLHKFDVDSALVLKCTLKNKHNTIYEMSVVERDGTVSEFCGNGARAVAAYLIKIYGDKTSYCIGTSESIVPIGNCDNGYFVDLPFPDVNSMDPKFSNIDDSPFQLYGYTFYEAQAFEPHIVTFDKVTLEQLVEIGQRINAERELFPFGMNINVVSISDLHLLQNTTFERGVNRITKSCGSGSACAMAVATTLDLIQLPCTVSTPGGQITIHPIENGVRLSGAASCCPITS